MAEKQTGKRGPNRDRLTPSQVADGINAVMANARRLADDARYLLDGGRLPAAMQLAILSIEESGKSSVLRGMLMTKTPEAVREGWRAFRSHRSKNALWPFVSMAMNGARTLDDFAPLMASDAEHTEQLDRLKQLATYIDCLSGVWWTKPEAAATNDLTTYLVRAARIMATDRTVTAREMELWQEYIGAAESASEMRAAVLRWEEECANLGLRDNTDGLARGFLYPDLRTLNGEAKS